jgi:hypothetical protein
MGEKIMTIAEQWKREASKKLEKKKVGNYSLTATSGFKK